MIKASDVKELRERTGSGMMDCKNALTESNGDMEKAIEILREKGLAAAAKKAGRIASEGIVDSYIHGGGRIGVLIEVNSETDFVAKNEEFKQFVKDMAMQVAASNPLYVKREDVDLHLIEKEKEIYRAQALNEGKPEKIIDRMVEGRIEKYYKEICLLEQPFIKDTERTVNDILSSM
ncbi:MAG TPA: translation elongation factor Ts, partial [Bacillota bacterium]|nr:translation elongation factor Ts [Bacillota bacterium]